MMKMMTTQHGSIRFKGNVAQVSEAIRVAITGQRNTPDLCTICQIIGKDNVKERIENTINSL